MISKNKKLYSYTYQPLSVVKNLQDFNEAKNKIPFIKNYNELKENFKNIHEYLHKTEYLHCIDESFDILFQWLKNWKNILILPDYDSDWINSCFMYYNFLTLLKEVTHSTSQIKIKTTCRDEWYWISKEFFDSTIHNDFDIIVTTDIWISVQFPLDFILKKQIIIFDHHLPLTNILFSIQEVHQYIKWKYQNFDFIKKTFDSQEEKAEIISECLSFLLKRLWKEYTQHNIQETLENLQQHFFVNNYVLNYYDDYFSWFNKEKNLITLEHREAFKEKNTKVKDEYDIHFYSSAWELAMTVVSYYLEKLIWMWLITDDFLKFKNIYLIWWCITAITDVTDLTSKNNQAFLLAWSEIFNIIRKEYNFVKYKQFTTDFDRIAYVLWKLFFKDKKTIENEEDLYTYFCEWKDKEWIKKYLRQILSFLKFYLRFDKDLSKTAIWFTIWPYLNSFWRMITTHSLLEQLLEWKMMNTKINEVRKALQQEITNEVFEDIIKNNWNHNIIVWWTVYNENDISEEKLKHYYRLLKRFYSEWSSLFIDYQDEQILEDEEWLTKESIEDRMFNKWWIVWIVASKIQETYQKPTIVWVYSNNEKESLHWSWRSHISLFELWVKTFESVKDSWWHDWAFWITISNVELFKKEFDQALLRLPQEKIKELFTINYDMLIEVKTFEEYKQICEELKKFEWLLSIKVSFKEILKNVKKEDIQCSLFYQNKWAQFSFYWSDFQYKTWSYRWTFWWFFKEWHHITTDDMIACLYTQYLDIWII